ncbi:MAG: hypothetical protein FJX25_04115 [Alphaproteobacteria bacterium]|nr:hypothetical protein [Alphaproteobacteria bacterium]
MKKLILSICLTMPLSAQGFECPYYEEYYNYAKAMEEMSPNTLCDGLSKALSSENLICDGGKVSSTEFELSVYRTFGAVPEFDVTVFAPSALLSKKVSGSGYESHKIKFIGFIDFNCTPRVLTYLYEPRFNLSPLSASKNPGNPNWIFYSDEQRLDILEKFLRRSFMNIIINMDVQE